MHERRVDALLPRRARRPWSFLVATMVVLLGLVACAQGDGGAIASAPQQPAQPAQSQPAAPAPDPEPAASLPKPAPGISPKPSEKDSRTEEPKFGGTFTFAVRADPRGGFDPHIPGGRRESRQVFGLAYERLASWDTIPGDPCAVALRPWLAKEWKFSSPTTLEVTLRPGTKFQNKPPVNGRELVAEDIIFSLRHLFDAGLFKLTASQIVSIEAIDKYTVRIKTKDPQPLVTSELFGRFESVILAREAESAKVGYGTFESVVGTGPFVLSSYTPGVKHVAVRNPDYWDKGRPYLERVELPIIRDEGTTIASFQVGKLDFVDELVPTARDRIVKLVPRAQVVPCENGSAGTLQMNHDGPPFNDVRVRRAVSMSIDRKGIVQGIFRGEGNVIGTTAFFLEGVLRPEQFPPETRKYLEHNPAEAKKLLAEAGYPNGFTLQIFGGLQYGSPWNEQLEALPAMLRTIGIDAKLKTVGLAEYQLGVTSRAFGAMVMMKNAPTGSVSPMEITLSWYHSQQGDEFNPSGVKDPVYDSLVDRMLKSLDPQERLDLARQLQIRLVDQAHIVVLPADYLFHVFSSRTRGEFKLNTNMYKQQTGLMLRGLWVAE